MVITTVGAVAQLTGDRHRAGDLSSLRWCQEMALRDTLGLGADHPALRIGESPAPPPPGQPTCRSLESRPVRGAPKIPQKPRLVSALGSWVLGKDRLPGAFAGEDRLLNA